MPNRRRRQPAGERPGRGELAFLLPFFGTVLMVPPLANLFIGKRIILFGFPLEALYLFAIWLFVIVGTLVLSWCHPFRDSLGSVEERPAEETEAARIATPDPDADPAGPTGID